MLPKIVTCSMKHAGLLLSLDSGREIKKVISIGDPGFTPPPGIKNIPDVLRLEFADEDNPKIKNAPSQEDVAKIIDFAQKIKDDYNGYLLIHCYMGLSRSTATAFIVNCVKMGPGKEEEALSRVYDENEWAIPNQLMVQMADDQLNRNGAMISALHDRPKAVNPLYV